MLTTERTQVSEVLRGKQDKYPLLKAKTLLDR